MATKPPTFSYLEEDAFHELLKKHQRKAMNCLIQGHLYEIDPVLGDASCQQRSSLMLDLYDQVQTYLKQQGKEVLALELVDIYDITHNSDKKNTKIKTMDNFVSTKNDPKSYNVLFEELREVMGDDSVEFLGLCYSLTVSCTWALEEFGLRLYNRSKNTYRVQDKENPDLYSNCEPMLRHRLSTLSHNRFMELIRSLSPNNSSYSIHAGSKPAAWMYLEQQLLETTHWMRSYIKQQHGDIDLIAIYPQFHAILLHEFKAKRPLIMMVRRIQMNINNPDGFMTYSLNVARALFFEPDRDKGTYVFTQSIPMQRMNIPAVVFDCWSTYHARTDGVGLKATDHDEYFAALLKCDLPWLIMTFAAGHPSFSSKAEEEDPDYVQTYKDICGPEFRAFTYNREGCVGFNLKPHEPGDHRPNLFEEWTMARQVAYDHNLKDAQANQCDGPIYRRIDRAVDLQVDHVNVSTFLRAQTHCLELVERHCAAAGSVIGSFIVWAGCVGMSCVDQTYAKHLSKMSNGKKIKKNYVNKYTDNKVFLKPLKCAW